MLKKIDVGKLSASIAIIILLVLIMCYLYSLMNMKINFGAFDLPQEGVIIVKPSDPEFDSLANNFLAKHNIPNFESLRPVSIFLKNNSSKAIVGHSISWRFISNSGKEFTFNSNYCDSPALTDGVLTSQSDEVNNETVFPGESRFITMTPILTEENGGGGGANEVNETDQNSKPADLLEYKQRKIKELQLIVSETKDIRISLDGVFFEDGSFKGTDTNDFFNLVKTHVMAKRDLVASIIRNLDGSFTDEDITRSLSEKVNVPVNQKSLSESQNQYNSATRIFAKHFLTLKQRAGRKGLADEINKLKQRNLPVIRKD